RDKLLVLSQPIGFRQSYQMLMAIEFPDDLAIAYFFEIEILELVKQLPRRSLLMHSIPVPIDLLSVIQPFVAKQIEIMPAHPLRSTDDFICETWQALFQQSAETRNLGCREEK